MPNLAFDPTTVSNGFALGAVFIVSSIGFLIFAITQFINVKYPKKTQNMDSVALDLITDLKLRCEKLEIRSDLQSAELNKHIEDFNLLQKECDDDRDDLQQLVKIQESKIKKLEGDVKKLKIKLSKYTNN
jgi:hypothetical protein